MAADGRNFVPLSVASLVAAVSGLDWAFFGTGTVIFVVAVAAATHWRKRAVKHQAIARVVSVLLWLALAIWALYLALAIYLSSSELDFH